MATTLGKLLAQRETLRQRIEQGIPLDFIDGMICGAFDRAYTIGRKSPDERVLAIEIAEDMRGMAKAANEPTPFVDEIDPATWVW